MATNFIQIPPNSTGLKVDTNELTVNGNVVERQSICIADPLVSGAVASVYSGVGASLNANFLQTIGNPNEGQFPVFGASFTGVSAGVGATTDFFTIFGSASKLVGILQIGLISTTATAAAYYDLVVKVASAAPTGGTATTLTGVQFDSTDYAPTAVVKVYTAAPTAAAYVGSLASQKQFSPITGTPAMLPNANVFNFGWLLGARNVRLRGVAQGLSVTLNGATPANATSFDGWIYWTE